MYEKLLENNQNLVEEFRNGNGVLFIGAGVSIGAGLPSWQQLIEPLAKQLGILLTDASLLEIAQYYVDQNAQGRQLLNKHVIESLTGETSKFSLTHTLIKEIPSNIIITTNYDTLLESAFEQDPTIPYYRVIDDTQIPYWDGKSRLLIKMNGCVSNPKSIVITRNDCWEYRNNRPAICEKIQSLMYDKTFLFLGFSFRDPVFESLYVNVLQHLQEHKKPFYFVALRSNKYQIEDKKKMGINVLDLKTAENTTPQDVTKFLEAFLRAIYPKEWQSFQDEGSEQEPTSEEKQVSIQNFSSLLSSRLGTGLSLQVNPEHVDNIHHYSLVYRQDLLDYKTGDFYSIRRLAGFNTGDHLSAYLIYSESSEQKITFRDTGVKAIDLNTGNELVVESTEDPEKMSFTHAFRIYFPKPLAYKQKFDVGYCIILPGELKVLSKENEIMSISLVRIKKGADRLEFNVCLNFKPRAFVIECMDENGNRSMSKGEEPRLTKYVPRTRLEKLFKLDWSSAPCKIEWSCNNPDKMLYIINYKK